MSQKSFPSSTYIITYIYCVLIFVCSSLVVIGWVRIVGELPILRRSMEILPLICPCFFFGFVGIDPHTMQQMVWVPVRSS